MDGWATPYLAGVSLTYDGSRTEHLEVVKPQLERFSFRATFFGYPPEMVLRVKDWQACAASGHEIGSGFLYGTTDLDGLIPNWPPETIEQECKEADDLVELISGKRPTSLAMPALRTQWSQDPANEELEELIAGSHALLNAEMLSPLTHYSSVRSPTMGLNQPNGIDRFSIRSVLADSMNAESLCVLTELALQNGAWLVLVFSGLRDSVFNADEHERYLIWLAQKQGTLRIDTFEENALSCVTCERG